MFGCFCGGLCCISAASDNSNPACNRRSSRTYKTHFYLGQMSRRKDSKTQKECFLKKVQGMKSNIDLECKCRSLLEANE